LLQKREETAISFASVIADSRVVDKPESSDTPVWPNKMIIFLLAFATPILLGFTVIYLKESLNRTIKDRGQIERLLDLPFLGEVVFDTSKSQIVVNKGQRSFISEQFRHLRTSLGYMGIDETNKKIVVTSSISGEGKSFIAMNLGISFSLMDKKVVLIELDLRNPKLSDQFKISRK